MKLCAEGIEKQFFRQRGESNYFSAVARTDFDLPEGQLTEVTGRSGSGKSTLLNMLSGLLAPTRGKVLLDGQDLYALPDRALSRLRSRKIGVIPQGQSALSSLTVLENVLLPASLYEKSAPPVDRAMALLRQMGIEALRDARPAELSGGELRRMAIARALINRPGILFCDEPTGDLDDENTRTVLTLLRQTAEEGVSVLLVTHEAEAAHYAHAIYKMDAGALTRLR